MSKFTSPTFECTGISNVYGTLRLWQEDDRYYWDIECCVDNSHREEISKKLYDAIVEHEEGEDDDEPLDEEDKRRS